MFESTLAWPYLRAASYLGSPYAPVSSSLNETVSALMDAGMTGAAGGIGIAVIDSGIVAGPEFEHGVTASYDFTKGALEASAPVDPYGHGTHVAGLIAGANLGIAPGARVIGLRVLDGKGKGTTSDVLRAIEFAIANKAALNLHVINLSLGHPIYEAAATDPLVQAVESAVHNGLVVSVSAGNFGIDESTGEPAYAGVASPGNSPSAITSGSTNMFDTISREDDRVSAFSSRGPTRHDGFLKPDLVSPGENVLSVAAVGSRLRGLQETRGNTGDYMRLSGTSMAAAVTSGVIALTLNVNPNLTANALKAILQYSAIPVLNSAGDEADLLTQGAGQINGGGAIALAWVIVADAPIGSKWLKPGYPAIYPSTEIAGTEYEWNQSILWGGRTLSGADLMFEQRPAWAANIVWGEGLGTEDDNIVWGNILGDDDNIVWEMRSYGRQHRCGNNIVWGSGDDNILWGNFDDDNIVWGNTVRWKSSRKGRSADGHPNGCRGFSAAPRMTSIDAHWRKALPVLNGNGFTLRELRVPDARTLLSLLTTEEVTRFISPPPTTIGGFERFINWAQREREAGRYVCFAVVPAGHDRRSRVVPDSSARSYVPHCRMGLWARLRVLGVRPVSVCRGPGD